jgi:hypothetical protein
MAKEIKCEGQSSYIHQSGSSIPFGPAGLLGTLQEGQQWPYCFFKELALFPTLVAGVEVLVVVGELL